MKITTTILAILVLFLSTQCVVKSNLDHGKPIAKETCCSKKKICQKESTDKKDTGCEESCNPFMACCGCSYILPEKPAFTHVEVLSLSVKTGFKKIIFISNYNADCWHPPEVV